MTIEDRMAAVEAELRRQRDHIEICQLIASYGPLVDTADGIDRARQLACLWIEDGIYDVGGVGAAQGREAITQVFAERHFGQVPEGVCHVMGLPYVTVSGDEGIALNYSCVFRPDGEERFFPWRVSANRWKLVRRNGRWLIHSRMNRLMTGEPDTLAMLREIDQMVATHPLSG